VPGLRKCEEVMTSQTSCRSRWRLIGLASLIGAGCGRPQHPAEQRSASPDGDRAFQTPQVSARPDALDRPDSTRAVEIAIGAIDSGKASTDRVELRVAYYRHDSSGFVISLTPKTVMLGGDGTVWISPTGSIKRVERGQ
jgi:hypothetical protein